MGTVYLAFRDDDQYRKRVAIKLISDAPTGDLVRYFRRERQILAALEHPNIAQLLDGGTTEDGRPYLVMEYVEGKPIHQFCAERQLPVSERLVLFRHVCAAVQHAHRNLVVHRDIKPGNILVTADGVPKLLDFGIAKLLNPELAGEALTATRFAMTPEYASPEQAKGQPITTATDVYSLGVVLYELLSGRLPYAFTTRQPLEILRAVVEQEPQAPSAAVARPDTPVAVSKGIPTMGAAEGTRQRLRRRLRGDLDNIILSALRKEPHRRYASVEAFSDDLARYLERRPIRARPATIAYRMGKFLGRNRLAVGSAALFVVLLVGFTASTLVQSRRAEQERDRAERERDKAQKIAAFLVDLFRTSDPAQAKGHEVSAREVMDRGAERVAAELQDQPDIQASLMHTLGSIYRSLGQHQRSKELLEAALQRRQRLLGSRHLDVADTQVELGITLTEQGEYEKAETVKAEALAARRVLLSGDHPDVINAIQSLGVTRWNKGDLDGAESLYREALAMRRRTGQAEDRRLANNIHNLGLVRAEKGDLAEAGRLFQEGLEMRRRVLGPDHPDVAGSLLGVAGARFMSGDLAGAEGPLREGLALQRRLFGDRHPDVAGGLNNLGELLFERGEYVDAEAVHRQALSLRRETLGSEHADVGASLMSLARALQRQGRLVEAEGLYGQSLANFQKLLSTHPLRGYALGYLGSLLLERGRNREAEGLFREALAVRQKALPANHPDIAEAKSGLGMALARQSRYGEAEAHLREGYVGLKGQPLKAREFQAALTELIRLCERRGEAQKAAELRLEVAASAPGAGR
jgi:serine/threonine-protein kinase